MPDGLGRGAWTRHPLLARVVSGVASVTWRQVDSGDLADTDRGPVLVVANHFGGAADAIVLMSVLPRRPRILADDTIWRYPVAKQIMEGIGAIPVHRGRSAKGGPASKGQDNSDMFGACHDALAAGEVVLIFPEGITREEPSIGKVRSGAARIALGARAAGVEGIRIVAVGIHYDDKAAFRSSVYVHPGEVIDLDGLLASPDGLQTATSTSTDTGSAVDRESAVDHEEVEELTALVDARLRGAAPNYDDWREARALQTAAEAWLRDQAPERSVPVGLRDRLGGWLATTEVHDRIEDAASGYRETLSFAGVDDTWATEGVSGFRGRSLVTLITWVLMLPYAAAGLVMHGVPLALSWLVSRIRLAPAVMATILPIASAALFAMASVFWLVVGWRFDTWAGMLVAAVMIPVGFGALVGVAERAQLWRRGLNNRMLGVGATVGHLAAQRSTVVDLVDAQIVAALGGHGRSRSDDGAAP
ncbi:MAG: 1-acyl-sn-glycerol-3-phosphate acyltransferase [Microthrixaceae bacterium]